MKKNRTEARVNQNTRGTIMVALSGFLYGMIGYFGMQLYYQGFSVPNMLFWRFLIAACWMLLIGGINRHKRVRLSSQIPQLLRLAAVGAVSMGGGSAFFYLSSLLIGTGPAMVIFFSFPVFVTIFAVTFTSSKLNRFIMTAMLMVIAGLVLLNGTGANNLSNRGIILGLVASFSYAVYVYNSQHSSRQVDSLWLTFFICVGCSAIFFVFSLATNSFLFPSTSAAWIDILVLGIVATAIPIQLLLNGLKYISSVKASILSVLEPVMTVIIGVIFLNERLEGMQVIGILIILLGAIVIQFEKQPEFKARTPLK